MLKMGLKVQFLSLIVMTHQQQNTCSLCMR